MKNKVSKIQGKRGFTLVEIVIGLLILGVLAGATLYTISKINQGASDTQKTQNAKDLTQAAVTVWQANVNIAGWTDPTTAITALHNGLIIPATVEGGQDMPIRVENNPNPAAYNYTAPDATGHGPRFDPILGHPEIRP